MLFSVQSQLQLPRNLRRSETLDWFHSQTSKRPITVVSRRFILASTVTVPVSLFGPSLDSDQGGLSYLQAEAQGIPQLISLVISALELLERVVTRGQSISAALKLDNRGNSRSSQGSTLAAVFDDRGYAESAIALGTALLAEHPNYQGRPMPRPDGQVYDYQAYVPPQVEYSLNVAMPTTSQGDKQLEAMTLASIESRDFQVG